MKKLLLLPLALFLLASCEKVTQQEIDTMKNICSQWNKDIYIYDDWSWVSCQISQKTTTMDCIREYTNWLDEKYNNPDTVTNLREDEYSKVVKTCNEVFGKTLSWSVNK